MHIISIIIAILFSSIMFPSKTYAEETKCRFPDIPSFSEGKKLPDGSFADLSFADYRTANPKGAALLLSCAQTLYKNANLSQLNDASRRRLDRTMSTTWHNHNTGPTAQKDGYVALGGSSELGSANDFGTMIIDPDKRLVAVGLILNNVDRIDESVPLNYVISNFVFIYNSPMDSVGEYITVDEMNSIIEKINHDNGNLYIFVNRYFMRSNL